MCSSKTKVSHGVETSPAASDSQINGRPVLQPTCNRVPRVLERRKSLKKVPSLPPPPLPLSPPLLSPKSKSLTPPSLSPPLLSPKSKSLTPPSLSPPLLSPKSKLSTTRPHAIKRESDINDGLNSSSDRVFIPKKPATLERNKSKKNNGGDAVVATSGVVFPNYGESSLSYISSLIVDAPGSIAAVRREQMANLQAQRKMKIAHYGRSKSAKFESKIVPLFDYIDSSSPITSNVIEEKRCSFITPNSDPLYIAYHDEEWGVPVHDDRMLFELLVLSGAQVGSDWTSILKKRQDFRNAFSEFDAEIVANYTEKQIISISADYGIDISRVRGVVDNSKRILEIRVGFGSFNKYIWGFVNHKLISTQYKTCLKIPVKTSKSETISKDMVRRGFRSVGPTAVHSFMQAAGLTNDHLISCHRHLQCCSTESN